VALVDITTQVNTRGILHIIFAASGFNRQFVVEEARIEIIMADVSEADSWAIMCQQGLVVLNCVRPFLWSVVRACIDFSGEPQFLERIQLDHLSRAVDSGVCVIGSCGFDSIPADMSILYTRDQFKGRESSYMPEGKLTIGTSAIYGFADSGSLRKLRKKFGHQPLPIVGAKVKKRYWQISDVQTVCVLCIPIQSNCIFFVMTWPSLGIFPEFSFGVFTKAGPSRKQMEGTSFSVMFFRYGYAEALHPSQGRPNARICTQKHGAG
uniref:Saccharopine dehydrogenase NADP binding domain-containing protein n=1 Tax=Hucho hucho TaxID=62062 RepID=A0A4W5JUD3_9TELE